MTLIAHVDDLACLAHGDCAVEAPDAFIVEEVATVTGRGSDKALLAAARACPAGAITLTDAETGEEVVP